MKTWSLALPRASHAALRRVLSLLAAATVAACALIDTAHRLGSADKNDRSVAAAESAYEALRAAHDLPTRVAFLQLPGSKDEQTARWHVAQYGMAPTIVTLAPLGPCLARASEGTDAAATCPLETAEHVVTDNASQAVIKLLTGRFGYRVTGSAGRTALLERTR